MCWHPGRHGNQKSKCQVHSTLSYKVGLSSHFIFKHSWGESWTINSFLLNRQGITCSKKKEPNVQKHNFQTASSLVVLEYVAQMRGMEGEIPKVDSTQIMKVCVWHCKEYKLYPRRNGKRYSRIWVLRSSLCAVGDALWPKCGSILHWSKEDLSRGD